MFFSHIYLTALGIYLNGMLNVTLGFHISKETL